MMGYYRLWVLPILLIVTLPSLAQQRDNDTSHISPLEKVVNFAESILGLLTYEKKTYSLAVYPAASYSGRTGLAIGVMPMLQLHKSNNEHPTTITPSILISTNKMFEIQCVADVYWGQSNSLSTKAEFFYLPDKYYGIGNQDKDKPLADYDFYRYMLTSDMELGLRNKILKAGVSADLSYHKFNAFVGDTISALPTLLYSEGWNNGVGALIAIDNRDNVLNPTNGWYVTFKALAYPEMLGCHDNYMTVNIDGRYYVSLSDNVTLANQLYWCGVWGDAPFYKLATCGGTRLGRAIPHTYKYIDNFAWLAQSEIRFPIYWRIGATAFAALGNVSHKIFKDTFDDIHLMAGAGLRFKVFPKQGLNVRIDAGIDSRGEHAVYFNIREAF